LIDKSDVKKFLVDVLKDNEIEFDEIDDDTVLVGEDGVFYDSVDVLELIVALENKYKIKVNDNDIIRNHFKTFGTFYNFIAENKK
jgi:acyl carrier protein